MDKMRNALLQAGVANLKEFGYPSVTTENILTDIVYKEFFKGMLKDNLGHSTEADTTINQLLKEIED